MSSSKKVRIDYSVHLVGGSTAPFMPSLDLLLRANTTFIASHLALVGPSTRLGFRNWFILSPHISVPLTALLALAIYWVFGSLTGMLPGLVGDASGSFLHRSEEYSIVALLAASLYYLALAVLLQFTTLYLFIWGEFSRHLKDDSTNPFVRPEFFQSDKRNVIFMASTSKDVSSPTSEVGGTLVLLVDDNHLKHPSLPTQLGPKSGVIRCVGASPQYHGCGMGRAMLRACIHHARSIGLEEVILLTTSGMVRARRLYEQEGFVEVRTIPEVPVIGYYNHHYRIQL